MASFTSVGDTTTLSTSYPGETVAVALSGTYDMTIALQREVGSPGSGAWYTIKSWNTADATVAYNYTTKYHNEELRLIVQVDTSGTCTATLTGQTEDVLLDTAKDDKGNVIYKRYEGGGVVFPDQAVLLTDANASIKASDSGKIHIVPNVSADRTFTLPVGELGLNYRFVAQVGAADGHDWIFATASTATLFAGGVFELDTDTGPTPGVVVADQSNDDAFQVNVPQGGTVIDMVFDGTYWVVSGLVLSTAAPVFS